MKIFAFATLAMVSIVAALLPDEGCEQGFLYDHGEMYGNFHSLCWTDPQDIHTYRGTDIDLNLCLRNAGGTLVWGSMGGAMHSCSNCKSRKDKTRFIDCACYTGDGEETMPTSIDLYENLYKSDDGRLACFNHTGTQSAPDSR